MEIKFLRAIEIRPYLPKDQLAFNQFRLAIHYETEFLRLSPEELVLVQNENFVPTISEHALLLLAFNQENIVGFLTAQFDRNKKIIDQIQLGVLQSHSGKKIGNQLFAYFEDWIANLNVLKIELKVMTHNEIALDMYLRRGYKISEKNQFKLYGSEKLVEDYLMIKSIEQ